MNNSVATSSGSSKGNGVVEFIPVEIFVTNEQRRVAEIVVDFTLSFMVSYLGIVTNIIVIVVFAKQGFKDSVTVSMTVIAVWDFFKCLGGAAQRMSGPIGLTSVVAAKSWTNISATAFNYFISFSTYVSSVLAAYVAVERCLCVSVPFKVKDLITPKMALVFGLLISFVVFGFMVMFFVYDIVWVYSEQYNATIAIYVNNNFFKSVSGPLFQYYNLSGIIWPTCSLGIIMGSTAIIVYHLRKSTKFRARSAGALSGTGNMETYIENLPVSKVKESKLSKRDKQVVKMLLVVIGVNVLTLTPRIIHYMAKYFVYEFYFLRLYHNLFICFTYFLAALDLINAAVPLFIFYPMSTSFRVTFWGLFGCKASKHPQCNSTSHDVNARRSL